MDALEEGQAENYELHSGLMRVAIIGKYPPIQGGTSRQTHQTALRLSRRGHSVVVITNANEVEKTCRQMLLPRDSSRLSSSSIDGSLEVHNTSHVGINDYIPWAQPYGTKLFGLGLRVLRKYPCDLIVGWYLEPYGVVAAQLAQALNIPFVLRHAGSDVGRLINHPDLRPTYIWAISKASLILTGNQSYQVLLDSEAEAHQLHVIQGGDLPDYMKPASNKMDLTHIGSQAVEWYKDMDLSAAAKDVLFGCLENIHIHKEPTFTIGTYGKIGVSKGTYDLLDAIEAILERNTELRYIALAGAQKSVYERFLLNVASRSSLLRSRIIILPFIGPWAIPEFLRLCDICCFLEREFAIKFHSPKVPMEILSCGVPLVCSGEIADKQYYSGSLVDRRNYIRVSDPRDQSKLRDALEFAIHAGPNLKDIGARGLVLSRHIRRQVNGIDGFADAIENFDSLRQS